MTFREYIRKYKFLEEDIYIKKLSDLTNNLRDKNISYLEFIELKNTILYLNINDCPQP